MIIKTYLLKRTTGRWKSVEYACVECDICHRQFDERFSQVSKQRYHFCSRECLASANTKGGIVRKCIEQTSLTKYGVESPTQSEIVKKKSQLTSLERYGVYHPMQCDVVKEKCKESNLKTFALRGYELQQQRQVTNQNRYGAAYPFLMDNFLEKRTKTSLLKYGTEDPAQSDTIKSRSRITWIEKYGTMNWHEIPQIRDKHDFQAEACKRHQTMKINGTYQTSKAEELMYQFLVVKFNFADVDRQCYMNRWPIDFYVKSINAYIQVDGVYWHGLTRDIEVIKLFKHPRDKQIYKKMLTDIEQNQWFCERGLRLIRVTDKSVLSGEFGI